MKGLHASQKIFFKIVDLSFLGIFLNNLMKSHLPTKYAYVLFFKQRLHIFSVMLSNKNKQRLYKIQKRPTSLFYHVLLIKQNECNIYKASFNCKYVVVRVNRLHKQEMKL